MHFKKEDTFCAKGLAIMFLLFHHLFFSEDIFTQYNLSSSPLPISPVVKLAGLFKICVAIFVFLSSYGLTIKYMGLQENARALSSPASPSRKVSPHNILLYLYNSYLSLLSNFIAVYLVAVLFSIFVWHSFSDVYGIDFPQNIFKCLIDLLGLTTFDLFQFPSLNVTWWYLSLAVAIIIFIPFLAELFDHWGCMIPLAAILIFSKITLQSNLGIGVYIFPITLGVTFAKKDGFGFFRSYIFKGNVFLRYPFLNKSAKFILTVFTIIAFMWLRLRMDLLPLTNGILAVAFVYLTFEFVPGILKKALVYLGHHSTNIFLIHTFIYLYEYGDFIYSFRHFIPVYIALLAVCLAVSHVIEGLKKLFRYGYLFDALKRPYITEK